MAEAFDDDPGFTHIFPSPTARLRVLPWFMGCAVRYVARLPSGVVMEERHQTELVALSLAIEAPGRFRYGVGRMLAAGFGTAPLRMSARSLSRFLTASTENERQHDEAQLDRHLYLAFLGTVPERQGRGHGSRLLQRFVELADERGLPAYLENSNPANTGLYERYGFTTTREWNLPDHGPRMLGMIRRVAKGSSFR
ncbi:MAG: GNAT family N-acetyltransferase [Myxococcota bacterium]